MGACLLVLVTDLAGAAYSASIAFLVSARGRSLAQIGIIRSLLMAIAWGLVFAAIWRGVSAPKEAQPE